MTLALVGIVSCGGGGGGSRAKAPVHPGQAAPNVASIPIALLPAAGPQTATDLHNQVSAALVAAGFRVVAQDDPDAITAELDVAMTEQASLFSMTINKQRQITYNVTAQLKLTDQGRVVEQVSTQFESDNGVVPAGAANPLVSALTGSPRLQAVAADRAKQQAAAKEAEEREQQRRERASAKQAHREEEEMWIAAKVIGCAKPATLDACEGVQRYLANYPEGAHSEEARQTLEQAKPLLKNLQEDDDYWNRHSEWRTCKARPSRDACAGVDIYVTKYPVGLHAETARQLQGAATEAAE